MSDEAVAFARPPVRIIKQISSVHSEEKNARKGPLETAASSTEEILWKQVLEAWGEEKRHQAFLGYCRESGRLADAARCYRSLADEKEEGPYRATEGQREDARKRLSSIVALAFAAIEAEPRTSPLRTRRWLNITALVLFLTTLGFLAWAFLRMRGINTD